jgi:hypothetical protein
MLSQDVIDLRTLRSQRYKLLPNCLPLALELLFGSIMMTSSQQQYLAKWWHNTAITRKLRLMVSSEAKTQNF